MVRLKVEVEDKDFDIIKFQFLMVRLKVEGMELFDDVKTICFNSLWFD